MPAWTRVAESVSIFYFIFYCVCDFSLSWNLINCSALILKTYFTSLSCLIFICNAHFHSAQYHVHIYVEVEKADKTLYQV